MEGPLAGRPGPVDRDRGCEVLPGTILGPQSGKTSSSSGDSNDNRTVNVYITGANKTPYQLYQDLQPYIASPTSKRRLGVREHFR